jgi:Flp pilus assembly protein TadD
MKSQRVQQDEWIRQSLRQGFVLLASGRLTEASDCCRRVLQARSDVAEAHFLVGLIANEMHQTWTAVSAFGSVTKLQPTHGAAWAHLARLFMSAGQPARADAALEKAVECNDGNPVVLDLIGTVHGLLGDQAEASRWLSKAVERQPENVGYLVNLANSRMFLGRLDEAEQLIRNALKLYPDNPNAHWILSNLRTATDRNHVDALEAIARDESRNPKALAFLNYALGKELEDLEDWDAAFDAFTRGAAARRSTIAYDEDAEAEMFQAFEQTFTRQWLERNERGDPDGSAIFIVGQPRTGTTLIERIITSHSQAHSAGELGQFGTCVRRLADYREPRRYSAKLAEQAAAIDAKRLGRAYLVTTEKMRGDLPRFVDKLPPNYLYLPLILKALPNAKIIHVTRDPMDACFACYKQLFADAYPHSYDLQEMARHHARYVHMMAVWRERFGKRFLDVSYEETVRDLEGNARRIIEYLGLPWEDACLQFHRQNAAVTTASAVQVRSPAHTRSIGRWHRYERRLLPLRQTLDACGVETRD